MGLTFSRSPKAPQQADRLRSSPCGEASAARIERRVVVNALTSNDLRFADPADSSSRMPSAGGTRMEPQKRLLTLKEVAN